MAYRDGRINFKAQAQKDRKLRRAPSKYKESAGRPNISMSPGVAPAYPAVPFKYLPVSFQDENTQDWVVMPKGRIASLVLSTNTAWDANQSGGKSWESGVTDANAGAIQLGDDSYYGVSKNIKGLLVPANGGVDMTYTYEGDSLGSVPSTSNSGSMVASGEFLSIGANAPVGVMEHDVYQDIRGANLNYDMRNKNWGVLAQQFIKLPCVDVGAWNAFSGLDGLSKTFVADAAAADTSDASLNVDSVAVTITDATTDNNGDGYADETVTFSATAPAGGQAGKFMITAIKEGGNTYTTGFAATQDSNVVQIAVGGNISDGDSLIAVYSFWDENAASDAPVVANSNLVVGVDGYAGYAAVMKKFAFLTFNSEKVGHGLAGGLLKSDSFGNWMHMDGNPISAGRSAQTVGRLLGVDNRFEKDLLDTVQSRFEDDAAYRVAGTGTYGVPQYLYNFAYTAMQSCGFDFGSNDEAKAIKDACDAGVFGESWIQLNCQ